MQIEEAISLNRKLLRAGNYDVDPKFTKAIKLGIQALKRIKERRDQGKGYEPRLLPGETED